MGKTIYVVTSGEYSDYGINAMFSTQDAAERFVVELNGARYSWGTCMIEAWTLDEFAPPADRGLHPFHVFMWKNGSVADVARAGYYDMRQPAREIMKRCTRDGDWSSGTPCLAVRGWFKDVPHAVKVANEVRAQIVALDRWKLGTVEG